MARSNQTKPTATPATTSARRTRTSPLNSEDPPDRDSRQPRTSAAARNTSNNHATQQNEDDSEDDESDDEEVLETKARIRALARGMSTVAHAENGIKLARQAIRQTRKEPAGESTKKSLKLAKYELNL